MRPRVIVHNEISVDGRMDFYAGDIGLYYEVAGRLGADASLAGSETIIKGMAQFGGDISDEPEENSPPAADRPLFAVVDSRGQNRPVAADPEAALLGADSGALLRGDAAALPRRSPGARD